VIRKFAADRQMWPWLAAGIAIVPLTFLVNALNGPGMVVGLVFAGLFSVWTVAVTVWTARQAVRREDEAAAGQILVQADVWVTADPEKSGNGRRYYSAFLGSCHLGDIEYAPECHPSRRWLALYRHDGVPSGGAFGSKRHACEALVQYFASRNPS
jgi:cytochrome c5